MWRRPVRVMGAVVLLAATTRCGSPSPVTPALSSSSPPTFAPSTVPPPVPTAPINATVGPRPRFTVTNVRAFPGCTAYTFEVSSSTTFQSLLATGTVNEETGQTSFVPLSDLPEGTLFWRARTVKNTVYCTAEAPSAFSSTQTFRVVRQSTYIDPPKVVLPANGSQQETRPIFFVVNSKGSDPSAAFVYRFDVSPSPTFSQDVVSTTVPEGNGRQPGSTEAVQSSDLLFDTTYYWRAQAIDTHTRLTSPFSPTFTFSTYGPRPGLSMLHVFMPGCNRGIGLTFDGNLANDGTVVRFSDSVVGDEHPLTFELSRAHDGWSGLVSGRGEARGTLRVQIRPLDGSAVVPAHAREASGQFSGTFNGAVAIWNQFGDGGDGCSDEFRWVILPPK